MDEQKKTIIKIKTRNQFNHQLERWCIIVDVNFTIPPTMQVILEMKHGVEVVQITTKYEMVIMIGKCFDPNEVEDSIKEVINTWED